MWKNTSSTSRQRGGKDGSMGNASITSGRHRHDDEPGDAMEISSVSPEATRVAALAQTTTNRRSTGSDSRMSISPSSRRKTLKCTLTDRVDEPHGVRITAARPSKQGIQQTSALNPQPGASIYYQHGNHFPPFGHAADTGPLNYQPLDRATVRPNALNAAANQGYHHGNVQQYVQAHANSTGHGLLPAAQFGPYQAFQLEVENQQLNQSFGAQDTSHVQHFHEPMNAFAGSPMLGQLSPGPTAMPAFWSASGHETLLGDNAKNHDTESGHLKQGPRLRSFSQRMQDLQALRDGRFEYPQEEIMPHQHAGYTAYGPTQSSDPSIQCSKANQAYDTRDMSYPEHVLKKASALYETMVAESPYTKQSTSPRTRPVRISGSAGGFACLDIPYPPPLKETSVLAPQDISRTEVPSADKRGLTKQYMPRLSSIAAPHHPDHLPRPNTARSSDGILGAARSTYQELHRISTDSGEAWSDPMHLAGCFAFALGEHAQAASWFNKVAQKDDCPIAYSNLALTSMACKYFAEAEEFWYRSLKIQPTYFEAAEHLVSLLCQQRRHRRAVQAIDFVRRSLKSSSGSISHYFLPAAGTLPHGHQIDLTRLLGLMHAKGNILYAINGYEEAAKAFEEVTALVFVFKERSLKELIRFVLDRLWKTFAAGQTLNAPILLTPEQAMQTMQACFGNPGYLQGLASVTDSSSRKAAFSITSNSLLSLAKIYQDLLFLPNAGQSQLTSDLGVAEILALYYLSLSIQPSSSTANNVGILLASVSHSTDCSTYSIRAGSNGAGLAMRYYQYGLSLDPKHAHLYTNLGSLLKDLGQLGEAIRMYERAIVCDPNFDIALANMANAVKDQGRTEEAIIYYDRAVEVNPAFVEAACGLANAMSSTCLWIDRGGVYMKNGKFDRWHVGRDGHTFDVRNTGTGSGWIQRVVNIVDEQIAAGDSWTAGSLRSDDMDALLRHALKCGPAVSQKQAEHLYKAVYDWCGRDHEGMRVVGLIERANRQTTWQWYRDKYIRKGPSIRDPQDRYKRLKLANAPSLPQAPIVLPFHTFTIPLHAKQIRMISQRNGLRVSCTSMRAPWLPTNVFPAPPPPNPHINIGYVSSDFNNHPLSHLMQSVFGMHDHHRVKPFLYATTPSDNSVYRRKIEQDVEHFHDASTWSTERLVKQILHDKIHILINLNGYTRGARNEVFAARPAPIQISFMGFAGSMGAEWSDYLLADEIAVPRSTLRPGRNNVTLTDWIAASSTPVMQNPNWIYNENIIYTRSSFFCCDHLQTATAAERNRTWQQEQDFRLAMRKHIFPDLPPETVILANFNQLYKIDPSTFRTWLRLLSRVPNAILWLLRFPASGEANLLRTAHLWAPPSVASRIRFTDVAPKAEHVARGCVADLFLDTPECNAHTTAADCLWSGTPLLTLPRYGWKMCSRMAGGILAGALPMGTEEGREAWRELCAESEEEYEEVAVGLAGGLRYVWCESQPPSSRPSKCRRLSSAGSRMRLEGQRTTLQGQGRLMELRKLVWESRWNCPLFDTKRWVRELEVAYAEAWRRWVAGEGGDIWLKDLINV